MKQHDILIVEDTAELREALVTALCESTTGRVKGAASLSEARAVMQEFNPALVILDFSLRDGCAFEVLEYLHTLHGPFPLVIVMSGAATRDEVFRLAKLGVRSFLEKPVDLGQLEHAIEQELCQTPSIAPQVRVLLGNVALATLEEDVRHTLVKDALQRSGGNRRAAARLLSVSRQVLQHILRKLEPQSQA